MSWRFSFASLFILLQAEDYCVHNQPRLNDSTLLAAKKKKVAAAGRSGRTKRGSGAGDLVGSGGSGGGGADSLVNPFIVLLRVLFGERGATKKQVFRRRALKILNVYTNAASSSSSAYINPMEALAVLPDDITVHDLATCVTID